MRHDSLDRRLAVLEAKQPDVDERETRVFLGKLTDAELDRLGEIIQRTDNWQKEPTEEEACFLAKLRAKYAN
jgi:hypothetical protein